MQAMFQVCQRGRESRWIVTLGDTIYGAYIDKEQALLDAVDAARDSLQAGREAEVWISDRPTAARVFSRRRTAALLNLLTETIENDHYPLSRLPPPQEWPTPNRNGRDQIGISGRLHSGIGGRLPPEYACWRSRP
jgi:hypothetical protein